jgi:hypothetical protein
MPDKLTVRAYESECENHRHEARRALTYAKQHIERALANLDGDDVALTYEGRQMVAYSAGAWAHLQALEALHRVRFLAEPDGED